MDGERGRVGCVRTFSERTVARALPANPHNHLRYPFFCKYDVRVCEKKKNVRHE